MAVGGCERCIKYLLFAFNLVFWMLGCAILGIGLYVRFSPESQKIFEGGDFYLLNSVQHTGAYILIAMGAVIMVVGFLGCCGAIRENQCLLVMFFMCLVVLFLVLFACGIWAFITLSIREEVTKKELKDTLQNKVNTYSSDQEFMDNLQLALACCGANNSTDYSKVGSQVPDSCGDKIVDTIQYETGCADKIFTTFSESVMFIGAAGLTVAIVLVFGMIFSMCLICGIRRGDYVA